MITIAVSETSNTCCNLVKMFFRIVQSCLLSNRKRGKKSTTEEIMKANLLFGDGFFLFNVKGFSCMRRAKKLQKQMIFYLEWCSKNIPVMGFLSLNRDTGTISSQGLAADV